jgi:hypothetical protein
MALPPKPIRSISCATWSKMPLSATFLMPKIAPKSFGFTSSVTKFSPYEGSARCQRRPISQSPAKVRLFRFSSKREPYPRDHNPEWPASRNHSKPHHSGRGVESPDRADALIGAVMIGPGSDPYVLNPKAHQSLLEMMQELTIRNEEDPWRVDRIVF